MPGRFDVTQEELLVILHGEPPYRARQVVRSLFEGRDPQEMTDLPLSLRRRLTAALPPGLALVDRSTNADGDTTKWLWSLVGGSRVETVLMTYRSGRVTVCVSTQAGCAMACSFCATGQAGFQRQLTGGEILEQVIRARRAAAGRVTNVVFMGMGEPLANYGPVWSTVERLHGELGLSARHLTVSTVGVVPGIIRLAGEALPVNLAVSLHAANDELRNELVPINKRYPLDVLIDACAQWIAAKGRRLSFEWALIDGVNDRRSDAIELAALARPLGAHVNLIPLNPTPGYETQGTPEAGVAAFRGRLTAMGVNATVRQNRGTDIAAACGQLAAAGQPPSPQPVLTE